LLHCCPTAAKTNSKLVPNQRTKFVFLEKCFPALRAASVHNPKGVAQQSPGLVRGTSAYPGIDGHPSHNPTGVAQRHGHQPLAPPLGNPFGVVVCVGITQGSLASLANPGLCWETPLGFRCSHQTPSKILSTRWNNCELAFKKSLNWFLVIEWRSHRQPRWGWQRPSLIQGKIFSLAKSLVWLIIRRTEGGGVGGQEREVGICVSKAR
jgi:hypothetical protein